MKELKFLYQTTIKKEFEEKVTEKKENGVEIITPVKKLKDVKIAILKPNRKLFEQAEIYYAKNIADFIKIGLLPYSLVAKRYSNDGGPLSEPEKERLTKLKNETIDLEKRFFELTNDTSQESSEEKKNILLKINNLNLEVNSIQTSYSDIFDNTAEVKARNRVIEWWTIFLALIDEDSKGYKPLFGEGNFDEKLSVYDDLEDKNDPFYNDVIKRLAYLVSFWFSAKSILTNLDFQGMEKIYTDTVSEYKPELPVEEKKTEPEKV